MLENLFLALTAVFAVYGFCSLLRTFFSACLRPRRLPAVLLADCRDVSDPETAVGSLLALLRLNGFSGKMTLAVLCRETDGEKLRLAFRAEKRVLIITA